MGRGLLINNRNLLVSKPVRVPPFEEARKEQKGEEESLPTG
jgi:hypothetical protein